MKIKSWYLGIITFENGYKFDMPGNSEEMIISKAKELWGKTLN